MTTKKLTARSFLNQLWSPRGIGVFAGGIVASQSILDTFADWHLLPITPSPITRALAALGITALALAVIAISARATGKGG